MATPKKTTTKKTAAPKKVAVKKTTKAKVVTKKVVTKKAPMKMVTPVIAASTNKVVAPKKSSTGSFWGWLLAVLLGGALIGTYAADTYWMQSFDAEAGMLVIDNKTWMPVGGTPVTVIVLNDKNCGAACDETASLDSLRASVTPALKIKQVDVGSKRGKQLIADFDLVSIPQYFFGEDIEALEVAGADGEEVQFIKNLPAGLLIAKDDLYFIDGARVGFKPGKFIVAPEFADLDSEPTQGDGPIQVVEFADMQCPYCKRFSDQNKTLIDQLVSDGTITYTIKDFPLSFHAEAYGGIHKAASCVLQEGGNDAYFAVKDQIYIDQATFSGIGVPAAEQQVADYASEQGVDIQACLANDGAVLQAEVMADIAEGSRYGVTGTPSIFVGTQILPGAVAPATLSAAVNAELNK